MRLSSALAVAVLFLSACAPPRPEEREIGIRLRDYSGMVETQLRVESSMLTHQVDAPVEEVWAVLPSVYGELEISIGAFEPETRTVGNRAFRPKRIGGALMSRYVDCGSGVTGRPKADEYQVNMFLLTKVDPLHPDTTRVQTEMFATAKSREIAGNRVQCRTKGTLERRISEMISEKVGG